MPSLLATATWEIAVIAASGAIVGAVIGGLLSFAGIVYSGRRERAAARRNELLEALRAYAYATDLWAAHLETLPPADPPPRWIKLFEKWVLGGERGAWVFARLLAERLFPATDTELRRLHDQYYEANGRLGLLAPVELLDVTRRLTRYLLRWQDAPGEAGLREYGPLRRELTDVARSFLGVEAIQRQPETPSGEPETGAKAAGEEDPGAQYYF